MSDIVDTYNLGEIEVTISRIDSVHYFVQCQKGDESYEFKAKKSEYEGYKRLMHRRIQKHFNS